jgi:hypothetical protein
VAKIGRVRSADGAAMVAAAPAANQTKFRPNQTKKLNLITAI